MPRLIRFDWSLIVFCKPRRGLLCANAPHATTSANKEIRNLFIDSFNAGPVTLITRKPQTRCTASISIPGSGLLGYRDVLILSCRFARLSALLHLDRDRLFAAFGNAAVGQGFAFCKS